MVYQYLASRLELSKYINLYLVEIFLYIFIQIYHIVSRINHFISQEWRAF